MAFVAALWDFDSKREAVEKYRDRLPVDDINGCPTD
jgi:hypothetical protein